MNADAFDHAIVARWNLEVAQSRAAYNRNPTALTNIEDWRDDVREATLAAADRRRGRISQDLRECLVADYRMLRRQGFSRQHIADRLGMAYGTLNRVLQRAARRGLINMEEL